MFEELAISFTQRSPGPKARSPLTSVYKPTSTAYDIPMAHPAPRPLTSIRDLIAKSDFARLNPGRASEILDRCADPLTEDRPDIRKELVDVPAR
jgi:hypothetical protein